MLYCRGMAKEIERKFLVADPPADLAGYPSQHIRQGYLVTSDDAEARVRHITSGRKEAFILTVKRKAAAGRDEIEIPIQRKYFEQLWPLAKGRRLEKTRYEIPHG